MERYLKPRSTPQNTKPINGQLNFAHHFFYLIQDVIPDRFLRSFYHRIWIFHMASFEAGFYSSKGKADLKAKIERVWEGLTKYLDHRDRIFGGEAW